jgi:hypothetical protein
MANNKFRDNHGVGPAEQEELGRLGHKGRRGGATREVPPSSLKPGRANDRANPARHEGPEARTPAQESEVLGDTYESNEDSRVSHKNK